MVMPGAFIQLNSPIIEATRNAFIHHNTHSGRSSVFGRRLPANFTYDRKRNAVRYRGLLREDELLRGTYLRKY